IPQESIKDKSAAPLPLTTGAHYGYARETDSALVQLDDRLLGKTYTEKFLFYRGVGNFDLPVTLRSLGGNRFAITASGAEPVHAAFRIQVLSGHVHFARIAPLNSTSEVALPTTESTIDSLGQAMAQAIVAEGMYEKEAQAMVKTWKSSWFGEDGTRLL